MERQQPEANNELVEPDSNTMDLLDGEWGSNAIAHGETADLEQRHLDSLRAAEEIAESKESSSPASKEDDPTS